jgi:hypothetical protein
MKRLEQYKEQERKIREMAEESLRMEKNLKQVASSIQSMLKTSN